MHLGRQGRHLAWPAGALFGALLLGACTYLQPEVGQIRETPAPVPGCASASGGEAGSDAGAGEDGEAYGPSDPYQNVTVSDAGPRCPGAS